MQNETIGLTSKNAIFNKNSFSNSEIVIGFVAFKWVQKWSWILILSPDWLYTQNETNFNCQFENCVLHYYGSLCLDENYDFNIQGTLCNLITRLSTIKLTIRRIFHCQLEVIFYIHKRVACNVFMFRGLLRLWFE